MRKAIHLRSGSPTAPHSRRTPARDEAKPLTARSGFKPRPTRSRCRVRFYEIVPMIEGGNVHIPNSASWLKEYRNQFMSFPSNGQGHDDMSVPEVRSCEDIATRSPFRARVSQRTARSAIAPPNATATPACSNPSAVQICPHARSRDPFMKPLVTRPVRSPKPRPTPSHVANEKRLRCCSLISNAYSGWVDCASVVQTEPKTSSY